MVDDGAAGCGGFVLLLSSASFSSNASIFLTRLLTVSSKAWQFVQVMAGSVAGVLQGTVLGVAVLLLTWVVLFFYNSCIVQYWLAFNSCGALLFVHYYDTAF